MAGSNPRSLHFVVQLNDAIQKLLYTEQAKRYRAMPCGKQWNAFPAKDWHHGDNELVNRVLVQEGPDDVASSHQPDVLASFLAEVFGEGTDRIADEVDARGHGSSRRPPREHIVQGTCT